MHLGDEVRMQGGKVILLSDNSWKNTLRQYVGAAVYRLRYRHKFDAVWVPGWSGSTLMGVLGVLPHQIFQGLYGSDPIAFTQGPALLERKKQFIFVGRLVKEKGIPELVRAFTEFRKSWPEWQLVIYGDGPLRYMLNEQEGITSYPFAQPIEIAEAMRESCFLVLPSHSDHWPLVVNEACLAGCGLILSDKVGNVSEFIGEVNGAVVAAGSSKKLLSAFSKMANLPKPVLERIAEESRQLGLKYTPQTWASTLLKILQSFER